MSGAIAVLSTGRPALGASALALTAYGAKLGTGSILTSASSVVTVIGGTAPYTYLWTRVSGSTDISPISGTSSTTKFSAYFAALGSVSAVYKCVVTDATATAVDTNTIDITIESL